MKQVVDGADRGGIEAGELSAAQEESAVHWLLQPQRSPRYSCSVEFDTPVGRRDLIWVVRSIDGKRLEEIERAYINERTGQIDDLGAAAELVAEATIEVTDATGATVDIKSPEFTSGAPSIAEALKLRFHYQPGLMVGIASRVREIGGWSPDRVGSAQRVLVDLVGNS